MLCLGAQGCGPVQHQHGVVPDVPLGVKSWLLGHADQGLHLGKPGAQLPHLPQGFQEYGGLGRFQKGLFQLGHDPLPGEGGQIHGCAQGGGLRGHAEAEPGRKLSAPQHPQGVFRKGLAADMAENPFFQVLPALEKVQNFPGQHVLHQGVDGEVPAHGRLFRAEKRVCKDGKIPVPPAAEVLLPGQGDVDVIVAQAVNAKACPHLGTGAQAVQNGLQGGGGDAVDLYVHILGVDPQQTVPDEAPHIVGSAPGLGHGCGNLPGHKNIPVLHRLFTAPLGTGGSPGRRK